jgi:hypothetical protein
VAARPGPAEGPPLTLDERKTDTAKERLADRASDLMHKADLLRTVQGARNIRYDLDHYLYNSEAKV